VTPGRDARFAPVSERLRDPMPGVADEMDRIAIGLVVGAGLSPIQIPPRKNRLEKLSPEKGPRIRAPQHCVAEPPRSAADNEGKH
jgi:hypothetical protein